MLKISQDIPDEIINYNIDTVRPFFDEDAWEILQQIC